MSGPPSSEEVRRRDAVRPSCRFERKLERLSLFLFCGCVTPLTRGDTPTTPGLSTIDVSREDPQWVDSGDTPKVGFWSSVCHPLLVVLC